MKRSKGEVEDFYVLLIIAIIIIAFFTLFSAILPLGQQPAPAANATVATFANIGTVGYTSNATSQNIDYGSFTVGQTQSDTLKKSQQLDICAGLWCSKSQDFSIPVPQYYMDIITDVKVYFAIYDSNQYGDLVVKWNGKEFYRGKAAARDFVVTIPKDFVVDSNRLQIYADGPGLVFWASSVYSMRDFRVDLDYGPAVVKTFTLSQTELGIWNGATLGFFGTGSNGQLRIRVNSNILYQSTPGSQMVQVQLNHTNALPRIGENVIMFESLGGGVFTLDGVRLSSSILTNQKSVSKVFTLDSASFAKLGSGRIIISLNSVLRQGEFSVKLNGKPLAAQQPSPGTNVVYFTSNEAVQGANTLEFSGTGYWDMGDVNVVI